MASAIRARLRAVFRRGAVEREMHDEMARHIEEATQRFVRRGMSAAEARDAAHREFGNVVYLQEEGPATHVVVAGSSRFLATLGSHSATSRARRSPPSRSSSCCRSASA
jgi:hypothetical protein